MKARGLWLLLGLPLLALPGANEKAKREREAFLERMSRVKEGWTEQQVLEVAGEPKQKATGAWYYQWPEKGKLFDEQAENCCLVMKEGRVIHVAYDSAAAKAARAADWRHLGTPFVRRMSLVKEGWSEQQVIELVGEPPYKKNGRWSYSVHDRGAGYLYSSVFTMQDGKVAKIEHSISCVYEMLIPELRPQRTNGAPGAAGPGK